MARPVRVKTKQNKIKLQLRWYLHKAVTPHVLESVTRKDTLQANKTNPRTKSLIYNLSFLQLSGPLA